MCSKLILNSYKIVRKNITNIIILACFLFTGCSLAVPEPDEANQTLLIIPVESRQTLQKFIWTLHVSIEDSSSNEKHNHIIKPNPKRLFSYSTQNKENTVYSGRAAENFYDSYCILLDFTSFLTIFIEDPGFVIIFHHFLPKS